MTSLADDPQRQLRDPVECKISIDGQEVSDFYPYMAEASVMMSRKSATVAVLLFDSIRTEDGQWLIQDSEIFVPWKPITISAKFGSHEEEVMRGFIKNVKVDSPQDMGAANVVVTCQDESIQLDREHIREARSSIDDPQNDGSIVSSIAAEVNLQTDVEDGLVNEALNQDATNVSFIRGRAQANGYEFYVREGTLHFHTIKLEGDPQPPILVYAGDTTNCVSFSAQYDGHRPDKVRVISPASEGTENEEDIVEPNLNVLGSQVADSSQAGLNDFIWNMQTPAGATREEVLARAQAAANENAWKVKADGELDGAMYGHVLLSHLTVTVDGVGSNYGGTYYVDQVEHVFTQDGYRQKFKLLRNAIGE